MEKLREVRELAEGHKSSSWHQPGFESRKSITRTYVLNHYVRVLKLGWSGFELQLFVIKRLSPVPLMSLSFSFLIYKSRDKSDNYLKSSYELLWELNAKMYAKDARMGNNRSVNIS